MDGRLRADQNLVEAMNFNELFIDENLVHQPESIGDINQDDSDFSDIVLNYINQMLMEEDIGDNNCMFQQTAALQAAEKSFYNVLMVNDQVQDQDHDYAQVQYQDQDHGQVRYQDQDQDQVQDQYQNQDKDAVSESTTYYQDQDQDHFQVQYHGQVQDYDQDQDQDHGQLQYKNLDKDAVSESTTYYHDQEHSQVQYLDPPAKFIAFGNNSTTSGTDLAYDISESSFLPNRMISFDSQSRFHPSYSLFSSTSNTADRFMTSPVSILRFPDMFYENRSTMQFQTGIDEASRFFPNGSFIPDGSRGKKNPYSKVVVEDERNLKQSAVYSEPAVRSEMFDDVLLCGGPKTHPFQCDFVCKETTAGKGQPKGFDLVKPRRRKQSEAVDLRILLTLCAQSVLINDQRGVTDLLKRIREHASPTGDGMQRMAHYFSDGLEARMAGSGTRIYKSLLSTPTSVADVLKAYRLFLGCFPFTKISHFVSNKTIMRVAQNKAKLHIIDFGILHGFQWPCLIQQLSTRPGGPPEVRITGIDFPYPGFRPAQRVEETGRRLAHYAETFGVGFKFKAIAQQWETIRIEDLELKDDEMVVVNCGYRFRNLLDETVTVDSPRKKVLDLIRKMKPEIFIHGIVNGSYGVPFFLTRFREALFFFSCLFDMLDATVERLNEERMLVEKTMWGPEAMNVIACENGERVERPETYKQWQVRIKRAGFRQVAIDGEVVKKVKDRGASDYHKDFIIDEDGYWMLQGWKGRILYAISLWKPTC